MITILLGTLPFAPLLLAFILLVTALREKWQMVEIESSIATCCQPDVHDVIGTWDEADESGDKEHGSLRPVVRFCQSVRAHRYEPGADNQQGCRGQYGAPVFAHLRVPPAVGVGIAGR
uniref:Putative secreted protein n=1 Tax=Anopheles darlingi TaxID=43151 RepID=A0A2M4DH02_ANODA